MPLLYFLLTFLKIKAKIFLYIIFCRKCDFVKVSTTTSRIADRFDVFTSLKIIADAGFDAADFSMFCMTEQKNCILNTDGYKEHVLKVKEYAESLGLHFNQAHAPFPPLKDGDEEYNKEVFPKVKRAIEIAGMLGIENIVVHPVVFKENQKEKNIEMYMSLLEDAKKANVKIALENMFGKMSGGKLGNKLGQQGAGMLAMQQMRKNMRRFK